MTPTWVQLTYLACAVCFILALKGLSGPKTARIGNIIGATGAVVAVVVPFFYLDLDHIPLILVAIALGTAGGLVGAQRVQMTQMPQMVALFNGVGGGAAALVALLELHELAPLAESSAAESALHERLLAEPRRAVSEAAIAAIADPDARDNYRIWLRFRDRLLAAPDLESAYAALFHGEGVDVPPLFVHQLTQVVLRHILGESADPFEARAAEMLFRPQRVSVLPDGAVMAADLQTVDVYATTGGFGHLGELLGAKPSFRAHGSVPDASRGVPAVTVPEVPTSFPPLDLGPGVTLPPPAPTSGPRTR